MNEDFSFIIDGMEWSFSRLSSFYQCRYAWKLTYIDGIKGENNFFGEYGSYIHKILEMYFKDELSIFELVDYYKDHYIENVNYDAPPNKFVDIAASYYQHGLDYFENFSMLDDKYKILGVEKKVNFKIGNRDFVGYIDLLLQDKESGDIIVVDHKSASIKQLKNGSISKQDVHKFEMYKRQMLLYSKAIYEEYGKFPVALRWNMFKQGTFIEIPFKQEEYNAALEWATDTINLIEQEKEFAPQPDDFFCSNLCNHRNNACQFKPVWQKENNANSERFDPNS